VIGTVAFTGRRRALQFSVAAIVAGIGEPALAAAASPDAELIRLSERLVALRSAEHSLLTASDAPDDPDTDPTTGPLLRANDAEWRTIMGRLADMSPTTLAGAQAMARAALANAPRDGAGNVDVLDDDRLLFGAIGWLAGERVV
jgi:hypothetical protein